MYMVDPLGNPDALAREVIGTVNLLARPHVIAQWLIALKWLNPHYQDLDVSNVHSVVKQVIPRLNECLISSAMIVRDPEAEAYENALGSDVAGVRNTEVFCPVMWLQGNRPSWKPNVTLFTILLQPL